MKTYNISIVLSFFGLWITTMLPGKLEIILGFILIFSFGILHGSNDILLINSISNSKKRYPFLRVLGIYLMTVLLAVIIFYFLPLVGLILFIIFSAYHFGEQHWNNKLLNISNTLDQILFFLYGLLVIQLLFTLNSDDVIDVVFSISGHVISKNVIFNSFILNTILFILMSIILYLRFNFFKNIIFQELFFLIILSVIFEVSTLIWGFTIYFIFWHSIPSLYDQVNFVYGAFNKINIYQYCIKAAPYWFISLVGLCIVYFIFKEDKLFYAIFFSFIAAVTFPHALVMSNMFLNKKNATK